MKCGAFTFVLHSHIPYCRNAGRWPHGEEWLHEAASETYLPLLEALHTLRQEGCRFRLTLSITPVLAEQLSDSSVLQHLQEFIEDKIERAQSDINRSEKNGETERLSLAQFYHQRYQHILQIYRGRFCGNIIGACQQLQEDGYLEIAAGAATHSYLPLLERDSSIYAQLKVGVDNYRRHFRTAPRSLWLPECGYRPGYYVEQQGISYRKPGMEDFLSELGILGFFAETHTVEGGEPVGKAHGEAIGPYGGIPKRRVTSYSGYEEPAYKTTYLPYWVQKPEVAVLGRNNRTGMQVWSADWGYPGDYGYREFHKKDSVTGLQYWRVTGARVDLGSKELYNPLYAAQRAQEHSAHYARLVEELLSKFSQERGRFGIITAAYDTELFGHWWFEGVEWLKGVLRRLSQSEVVELTTASDFIEQHPPEDVLALLEGSWGQGGTHFTWINDDTREIWQGIHQAELRMEELVAKYPEAAGTLQQVLNQAAREVLLLQSSDWTFLITTGQARQYAITRFQQHMERFQRLAALAERGATDPMAHELCQELWEQDKVFSEIDYRVFKNREGFLPNSGKGPIASKA